MLRFLAHCKTHFPSPGNWARMVVGDRCRMTAIPLGYNNQIIASSWPFQLDSYMFAVSFPSTSPSTRGIFLQSLNFVKLCLSSFIVEGSSSFSKNQGEGWWSWSWIMIRDGGGAVGESNVGNLASWRTINLPNKTGPWNNCIYGMDLDYSYQNFQQPQLLNSSAWQFFL